MITALIILLLNFTHSKDNNQLGVGFSNVSGAGASYNYKINSKLHFDLNSFYFYIGENPPMEYDTYFTFGGELQYNLFKYSEKDNRVYFLIGSSIWNINQHYLKDIPSVNGSVDFQKVKDNFRISNFGFGLGNELIIKESYSLNFSLLYQFQNSDVSKLNNLIDRSPNSKYFNGLGFGLSIRYRF